MFCVSETPNSLLVFIYFLAVVVKTTFENSNSSQRYQFCCLGSGLIYPLHSISYPVQSGNYCNYIFINHLESVLFRDGHRIRSKKSLNKVFRNILTKIQITKVQINTSLYTMTKYRDKKDVRIFYLHLFTHLVKHINFCI